MDLFKHASQCLTSPSNHAACHDFWFYFLIIFLCLCFAAIIGLIISLFKERAIIKAYHARKANRAKVADADVMEQNKWNGEV